MLSEGGVRDSQFAKDNRFITSFTYRHSELSIWKQGTNKSTVADVYYVTPTFEVPPDSIKCLVNRWFVKGNQLKFAVRFWDSEVTQAALDAIKLHCKRYTDRQPNVESNQLHPLPINKVMH